MMSLVNYDPSKQDENIVNSRENYTLDRSKQVPPTQPDRKNQVAFYPT
jgi:hypothetical protein